MIAELEKSIARYKEEYAALISQAQAIKADLAAVEAKVILGNFHGTYPLVLATKGRLLTRGLTRTAVLRKQWAFHILYKRVVFIK